MRDVSVLRRLAVGSSLAISVLGLACAPLAHSQVIFFYNEGKLTENIDRRYTQIEPTNVSLPQDQMNARGHQDILRVLTAEQGFAMRPLPRGKKGLTLTANGKLAPAGEKYLALITEQGLSVKAGDRVVLSNVRLEKDRIIFDVNGGPDHKHNFLRHVQLGTGTMTTPVVQDNGEEPTGSRITLAFNKYVPDVTPAQVKALLAPLVSFDMKTPVQAYTDTLPPKLKQAILNHQVLVGMNTDMVLFALGQPETKSREMDGQMPFEEWIYGHPPQDVNFVRVNGNRVIRVEVAKLGQPLEIFTKDEVEGMMTVSGRPVVEGLERPIQMGDVHRDPNTQAPEAPPSLRAPGETLPQDNAAPPGSQIGPMKPVIFPKDTSKDPAHTVDAHPAQAKPTPPADPDAAPQAAPSATPPADGAPKQLVSAGSVPVVN